MLFRREAQRDRDLERVLKNYYLLFDILLVDKVYRYRLTVIYPLVEGREHTIRAFSREMKGST